MKKWHYAVIAAAVIVVVLAAARVAEAVVAGN